MTRKVRVAPNLAIAGPFRSGAAVAPGEERCSDLHAITDLSMTRGDALCLTLLRVWQKSRRRGGKSPALLVSSILNATRYHSCRLPLRRLQAQLYIALCMHPELRV